MLAGIRRRATFANMAATLVLVFAPLSACGGDGDEPSAEDEASASGVDLQMSGDFEADVQGAGGNCEDSADGVVYSTSSEEFPGTGDWRLTATDEVEGGHDHSVLLYVGEDSYFSTSEADGTVELAADCSHAEFDVVLTKTFGGGPTDLTGSIDPE